MDTAKVSESRSSSQQTARTRPASTTRSQLPEAISQAFLVMRSQVQLFRPLQPTLPNRPVGKSNDVFVPLCFCLCVVRPQLLVVAAMQVRFSCLRTWWLTARTERSVCSASSVSLRHVASLCTDIAGSFEAGSGQLALLRSMLGSEGKSCARGARPTLES
jgi:hypothetical protein